MLGLGLTPNDEQVNKSDASTGYRRWLIALALSSISIITTILSVAYGYGADTRQIQQNKDDIKLIQQDLRGVSTKDDIRDLRDRIDRLDERIQRMQEREIGKSK